MKIIVRSLKIIVIVELRIILFSNKSKVGVREKYLKYDFLKRKDRFRIIFNSRVRNISQKMSKNLPK